MFQKLQKERESEEQKLVASIVSLEQQQGQLERELMDQKSKLEWLLTDVSAAEGRLRTLQKEERCTESLEKMLSQASTFTADIRWGWGAVLVVCWRRPRPGHPRRRQENQSRKEGSVPVKDGQGCREAGQVCLYDHVTLRLANVSHVPVCLF